VPDHATLSRRSTHLSVELHRIHAKEPIHLVIDSTGLSVVGEGEWAAVKHGGSGKRGCRKLHIGADGRGAIVAHVLTQGSADDAVTGLGLIEDIEDDIASVTADAAYDTIAIYRAADARGARVVVPPMKSATVPRGKSRSRARDRTVKRVKEIGRRRWKKESGYHVQARVENAFVRYKSIIGDRLRSRCSKAREAEALIACNILNRMTARGTPASYTIGA
jgi:hypothetical protein